MAQRTRRRPGARSTAGPARALVRDFRGPTAEYRVEFDARPVYDFAVSLTKDLAEVEDLERGDRRWLTAARDAIAAAFRRDIAILLGTPTRSGICQNLAAIAVEQPRVTDAASFVAAVDRLPDRQLLRWLLSDAHLDREVRDLLADAAGGDAAAQRAVSGRLPAWYRRSTTALLREPDRWIGRLRALLHGWLAHFAPQEERIGRMLERDQAIRGRSTRQLAPLDVIEATTGGIRWLPEPGVRRIVLAPSYFARPANYVFSGADWRLFCYPLTDAALEEGDPLAPPPAAIRLYRALGDETRMRILRLLTQRDHYLTELAQVLELSKPTIKHHLVQLRAAGLLTVTDEGALSYYSLRRERLDEVDRALRGYLGH